MAPWTLCPPRWPHRFVTTTTRARSALSFFTAHDDHFSPTGHCSRLPPSVVSTRSQLQPTVRYLSNTLLRNTKPTPPVLTSLLCSRFSATKTRPNIFGQMLITYTSTPCFTFFSGVTSRYWQYPRKARKDTFLTAVLSAQGKADALPFMSPKKQCH